MRGMSRRKQLKPLHILDENSSSNNHHQRESMQKDDGSSKLAAPDPGGITPSQSPKKWSELTEDREIENDAAATREDGSPKSPRQQLPVLSQQPPITTSSTSLASPSPEGSTSMSFNQKTSIERSPDDEMYREGQKENICSSSRTSEMMADRFNSRHEVDDQYKKETSTNSCSNVPEMYSGLAQNYSTLQKVHNDDSPDHQGQSHHPRGHYPEHFRGRSPLSSPVPQTTNGTKDHQAISSSSHPSTSNVDGYNMFYAQHLQLEAMQSAFTYSLMGNNQGALARNVCPWCGVTKAGPAALRRHLLKHTGERPFTCQLCNKSFKAKRNLQYHQYMHHGVESRDSNISERFCEARKRKLELETTKIGIETPIKHYYQMNGQLDGDHKFDGCTTDPYVMYSAIQQGQQKLTSMAHQWESHMNYYNNLKQLEAQDENGNRKSLTSFNVNSDLVNFDHHPYSSTTIDGTKQQHYNSLEPFDQQGGSPHHSAEIRNGTDLSDMSSTLKTSGYQDGVNENCDISGDEFPNGNDKDRASQSTHRPFTCELCGKSFSGENSQQDHLRTVHNVNIDLSKVLDGRFLQARRHIQDGEDLSTSSVHNRVTDAEQDMVHRPWRTVRDELTEGEGGEGSKNTETTPPDKLKQSKSSHSSRVHGSYGSDIDEQAENTELEYPSAFPGLKHQISIKNETVLVTRLDGINRTTHRKVSLYKCHICSQMYNSLSRLQCHLSIHYDRHLNVYQCSLCGANFKFRIQLHRHMKKHRRIRRSQDEAEHGLPASQDDPDGDPQEGCSGEGGQGDTSRENLGHSEADSDGNASQTPHKHIPSHIPGYSSRYIRWHNHRYSRYTNRHYICSYCNKTFYRLFSLQRHERIHTGYKPCHCSECGKGFSEPRNLRLHRMRYHRHQDRDVEQDGVMLNSPQSLSPKPHAPQSDMGDSIDSVDVSQDNADHIKPSLQAAKSTVVALDLQKDDMERPLSSETPQSIVELSSREPLHLASQIRQTEQLDEDVTVVIPTDAPAGANDSNAEAPRSNISDNTSWGDVATDSDSSQSNEIVSAPWKSIMTHKQALKSKRKSLPHRIPSPASPEALNARLPSPDVAIKQESSSPSLADMNKAASEATSVLRQGPLATMVLSPMVLSGVSREGSLPALAAAANPLYLHSSMMPGLTTSSLSFLQSNPSLLSPMVANMDMLTRSSLGLHMPHHGWSDAVSQSSSAGAPVSSSPTPSSSMDASAASSAAAASLLYSRRDRSSSLSRTHSRRGRLNVVRRDPLRREEACKPTLLPDGRTVYRCSYCNKDFGSFSDINRHMDFHEDIRPYKCKFCDYYARTNSQLKVHMMRHQGIREFHCKLCNYKGVTQSDLNRHTKSQIHIMKAQNECRLCGEGFVSPKNLEKHIGICSGHRSNNSSPSSSGHSRLESPSTSRLEQSYYIKTEHN